MLRFNTLVCIYFFAHDNMLVDVTIWRWVNRLRAFYLIYMLQT